MKHAMLFAGLAMMLIHTGAIPAQDKKSEELLKQIDVMMDNAMKAYNDNDAKKFYADFIKNLRDRDNPKEDFALFFHDEYKQKYGKYTSRKVNKEETVLEDDLMVVQYLGVFEKNKKVKITVSLAMEDKKPRFKLIQLIDE